MNINSYNLPYTTMVNLMRMIDLGQLSIIDYPHRRELSEIYRFIQDYTNYKSRM